MGRGTEWWPRTFWSAEIHGKNGLKIYLKVPEVKFDTILLAFLRELDKMTFYVVVAIIIAKEILGELKKVNEML